MKTETRVTIILTEHECRTVNLPPDTTQVIIPVVRDEEEKLT